LDSLIKRWVDAGREVALEIWHLTKNNDQDSSWDSGNRVTSTSFKRGLEESWGWESGDYKRRKYDDGESHAEESQEEHIDASQEEKLERSFEVMLRQLGIDPATFGWNEEEGEFAT
jgi:hypothetical protein